MAEELSTMRNKVQKRPVETPWVEQPVYSLAWIMMLKQRFKERLLCVRACVVLMLRIYWHFTEREHKGAKKMLSL